MIIHLTIDTSSDEIGVAVPKEFSKNLEVIEIINDCLVQPLKDEVNRLDTKLRKVKNNDKKSSNTRTK